MSITDYYYPPDDCDMPCEVCGESPDNCICTECQECGSYGDPECYIEHGLRRTEEQKFNLEIFRRAEEKAAIEENKMWDEYEQEYEDFQSGWDDPTLQPPF